MATNPALGRHQEASCPSRSDARAPGIEQDLALGQPIVDLRTAAGLSQRELAERIGATQSVISRLEEGGGAKNRLDTLARVATALERHLIVSFPEKVLPGTYGSQYTYPTSSEVDYFVGKGMNTFRMPFRWERLQRTANSSITDAVAQPQNAAEMARMDAFVNYATNTKGAYVIIEPHNFQRYYPSISTVTNFQQGAAGVISGTTNSTQGALVTDAMFNNFWGQLADHYKGNSKVIFNLMNEPANVNQAKLVTTTNGVIAEIRSKGANNLILVPGNRWTGAWTWNNSDSNGASNAASLLAITDSANNFAFDVHQYLDSNGSGTSASIVKCHDRLAVPDGTLPTGCMRTIAAGSWVSLQSIIR